MDNERACPSCGKQISSNASFCPYCGHKVEAIPVPPPVSFCPNCGSKMDPGAKFCTNCGTKLDGGQSVPEEPVEDKNVAEEPVENQAAAEEPKAAPKVSDEPKQDTGASGGQEKKAFAYGQSGQNQGAYTQQTAPATGEPRYVGFVEAIKLFFKNYVNFTGRACRSEFWWAVLFTVILSCIFRLIPFAGLILSIVVLWIPSLSILIRRMHDIGKKWPWILLGLIPFVGWIIMIVFCVRKSEPDNDWGPVYRDGE